MNPLIDLFQEKINKNEIGFSKKGLLYMAISLSITTFLIALDIIIHTADELLFFVKIYMMLFFLGLTLNTIMSILKYETKFTHMINTVIKLLLFPLVIISFITNNKTIGSVTMPMIVLIILVPLILFLTNLLKRLNLSDDFKNHAIPYLNLIIILFIFSYSEPYVFNFLLSLYEKKIIKQQSIFIFWMICKEYHFIKISFWFLALLTFITTLEKLSNTTFFIILGEYKSVVIQALITLVAFDRAIDKTFNFPKSFY